MLTTQTQELLNRLKRGEYLPEDIDCLEQISARELVTDLTAAYRWQFQERHIRTKWEIGIARSLRYELITSSPRGSLFCNTMMIPVFRSCLFLVSENDRITGISVTTRLTVRQTRKPTPGVAMAVGRGFKLDHMPDGWQLKPLGTRTVKLTDELLLKRGWQFDALHRFALKS